MSIIMVQTLQLLGDAVQSRGCTRSTDPVRIEIWRVICSDYVGPASWGDIPGLRMTPKVVQTLNNHAVLQDIPGDLCQLSTDLRCVVQTWMLLLCKPRGHSSFTALQSHKW